MEPVSLLAVLGVLLGGMTLKVIEEILYSRNMKAANRAVDEFARNRNVILPASLTQEDFDWFCWSMEMAGLDKDRVVNTCSCGYAQECYMHCNHELNDGKCTGHAWKSLHAPSTTGIPWSGKFQATQKTIETQHRKRSVSDQKIADFKAKMIANRNAKMKAEFQATKKRGTPSEEMEALRKRIDEREIKLRKYEARLDRLAKAIEPPKPQYISSPVYSPVDETITVYGRKISRHMLEDLYYNGGLSGEQLKEIILLQPEPEYETVYGDNGMCYPVRVAPRMSSSGGAR